MKNQGLACVVFAAVLATGCAHVSPATPSTAIDPVGTYSFTSQSSGDGFQGTITIAPRQDGTLGGNISTPVAGELEIRSVKVSGETVTIVAAGKQGDAELSLDFSGANFAGRWVYGGSRGFVAGTRTSGVTGALSAMGESGITYTGTYEIPAGHIQLTVFEDHGHLAAQGTGQRPFPLLYLGAHRFQAPKKIGIEIWFNVEGNRAVGFELHQHGKTYPATRVP